MCGCHCHSVLKEWLGAVDKCALGLRQIVQVWFGTAGRVKSGGLILHQFGDDAIVAGGVAAFFEHGSGIFLCLDVGFAQHGCGPKFVTIVGEYFGDESISQTCKKVVSLERPRSLNGTILVS